MNLTAFHFIRPTWLLALLPYAILLTMWVRSKLSQGNWTAVCDPELLPYLLQDKVVSQSRWPLMTGAFTALMAIIALAGPTWERLPMPVFRNDSALVITLDLSHSMDAGDIKPSRLAMARFKITDILKQRKDGQTALIVFAGNAFTVTPLTNDTDTIENQLSALTTEIMPVEGNNMALALEKADALFKQAGLQKGQILLITDGGNIDEAIANAKSQAEYQLLVLGVGSTDGAPIALKEGGFLKDVQGSIIVEKLDVDGLEKLAQAGGGAYQTITPDDSDIQTLFSTRTLQDKEKGEKNENLLLDQWRDVGPYLVLVVLPFAALGFRKGLLSIALLLLLPLPKTSYALDIDQQWRDLWKTKDQQAQEAFNHQQYDQAAALFENPDWKAAAQYKSDQEIKEELKEPITAVGYYNQGNVLAKSGDYKKAIAKYANALNKAPDARLKDDIEWNKRLVEKALEDQDKEKRKDQQKKDNKQDSKDKNNQEQNKDGDKSEQSQQDKSQESKDSDKSDNSESGNEKNEKQGQKADEQKPENKPEQSQQSTEKQPEKKQDKKEEDKSKSETPVPQAAEKDDQKSENPKPEAANAQPIDPMTNEEKQASEQWLKRIPDDPAGLLRRKFKYQYDQQR